MNMCRILLSSVVALALAGLAPAQDKAAYAEAMRAFGQDSISKEARDRAAAARNLGNATYDAVDKRTVELIINLLKTELGKDGGPTGKYEERVAGEVLDGCVDGLRRVTNPQAINILTAFTNTRGGSPRFRAYVVLSLSKAPGEETLKRLTELVDDKEQMVQIAAVDALVDRADAASLEVLIQCLPDPKRPWEVKIAALKGIQTLTKDKKKDGTVIEPLIEVLGKFEDSEGRIKVTLMDILNELMELKESKAIRSAEPNVWREAWAAVKEGKEPGGGAATQVEPTEFFGLKIRSTRIIFILDRTGSMEFPCREPKKDPPPAPRDEVQTGDGGPKPNPSEEAAKRDAKEIKQKYDNREVKQRMDALKKEYINTIYNLDKRVNFTTIFYSDRPELWKPELVPATWANKLDAIKYCDKINPSGPTNIWNAVELAFKLTEKPARQDVVQVDEKGNYATVVNGADTFFLMTDGKPNTGRVIEPNAIIQEIQKVNRLRKVVINTICVGDPNDGSQDPADPAFLKEIADKNEGSFFHYTGK